MLRDAKLVRYPFGNYWWVEVNPHEYQIRRADPAQTIAGRLVEVPAHGRDKGKWILPDANQEYQDSQSAVMALEIWDKLDKVTAPPTPAPAPLPAPPVPAPDPDPAPHEELAGWLSVQEVARMIGVPDSTVHGRVKAGQLKARKALVRLPQGYSRLQWRIAPLATQDPQYLQPHLRAAALLSPAPEPEPDPPALASVPTAPTEGYELQRQLTDWTNTYQADMRDLNRDIGRVLVRLETIEHALAQLHNQPPAPPPATPSFWQRLTGTSSNGHTEGGQP